MCSSCRRHAGLPSAACRLSPLQRRRRRRRRRRRTTTTAHLHQCCRALPPHPIRRALQARSAFTPSLSAALGGGYKVVAPATPSKADQNSLVVLRTAAFDAASVADVTAEAMGALSEAGKGKVASGDLLVVTATAKVGATPPLFSPPSPVFGPR